MGLSSEQIRLGLIGAGQRGKYLLQKTRGMGGLKWTAVCDAWDERCHEAEAEAGASLLKFADYRKLLECIDVDAVVIATLDHWHARMTADACEAGKHVYVEKPMTSAPEQGRTVVEAVRRTGRVVQVGTQQRSTPHFIEAKRRFIDSGAIGRVHMVRTWWHGVGYYLPAAPPFESQPVGLDWSAFLGDLPPIPWDARRFFHPFAYWSLSTGGQTGGLLVHLIDVVHWYLNLHRLRSAVASGGIYCLKDDRDTPDTLSVVLDYESGLNVTFDATLADQIRQDSVDIVFHGTGGRLSIFRKGYRFLPCGTEAAEEVAAPGTGVLQHMDNWLECIRTGRRPSATVVDGHYSAMACHLANMAYRSGERVRWNPEWDVPEEW